MLPPPSYEPIYDDVTGYQEDLTALASRSADVINRTQEFLANEQNRSRESQKEEAPSAVQGSTDPKIPEPPKAPPKAEGNTAGV